MASRIKIRLILELNASGMSQNDIARTRHMSRSSISTVMRIEKEKNITYEFSLIQQHQLTVYP